MGRMLRGGQVRLKLFMSLLWMQTDGSKAVPLGYYAQMWARLLGLPDPSGAGARRINEALKWLEDKDFITIQAQSGQANRVTVLNETGDGTPYTPPGRAANLLRKDPQQAARHFYAQLPADLWTNGYMAALNGAGLAFLLILLDQHGPGDLSKPRPVWFSPRLFKDRYGLSDDTRVKGMNNLRDFGLIVVARQAINPQPTGSTKYAPRRCRYPACSRWVCIMSALTTTLRRHGICSSSGMNAVISFDLPSMSSWATVMASSAS